MALIKLLHLLSVVIWVGGMFFAYVVLRPAAAEILQPPDRLKLWDKVFSNFFTWVWVAVGLVLATGLYMIYLFGGMGGVGRYIHIMLLLGIVMMAIFVYVYFIQYVPFRLAVAAQEWPKAGAILVTIRKLVATNVVIGLITFAVVIMGRAI
ncbi:MAG: CopD family protein [Gallionellaceae bacterium]